MDDDLAPLVEQSRAGDTAAFAALVAETKDYVYNLAYNVLGNPQEAEDMTQEVYVRVWRALPDFRAESKFTTWLYRIAINACLNRRRQLRREMQTVDHEDALQGLITAEDQDSDPVQATVDREVAAILWQTVDRLPDKYRLVIALFYQEGLSYEQIADLLSLPLGTVKSHLSRARSALAMILLKKKESHRVSL